MAGLGTLPNITRLSRTVVRILGQNPGSFTLQGTNTYLVGEHNPFILVDTGEGRDAYPPVLQEALQDLAAPAHTDLPLISDIILTHKHHDHCGGLPSVLTLLRRLWLEKHEDASTSSYQPPRIHKIPLPIPDAKLQNILLSVSSLPAESYTPDPAGNTIHNIQEGQLFSVTTSASDATSSVLQVLHTPGHTDDSLCLYYPQDHALFTADTVLGHGSTVFEDLRLYMGSLRKMIDFGEEGVKYGPVYPGHGPVVEDGFKHVSTYLKHRVVREDQILRVIEKGLLQDGVWTTWSIVQSIYSDYPRELWEPAAHSVDMHLRKLQADGRVSCHGGDGKHTEWVFLQ